MCCLQKIDSNIISVHPSLAVWGQAFWACKGRGIFRTLLNYCNGAPLEAWSRCYAAWQDVSGAEPLRRWHRRVYHWSHTVHVNSVTALRFSGQEPSSTSWLLFGRSGRLRGQSSGASGRGLKPVGLSQFISFACQQTCKGMCAVLRVTWVVLPSFVLESFRGWSLLELCWL